MKRNLFAAVIAALPFAATADTLVGGYVRSDGTYVAPHVRSSPNSVKYDNYSAQGNTNPYTGDRGSQRHELSPPPRDYQAPAYPQGQGYPRSR